MHYSLINIPKQCNLLVLFFLLAIIYLYFIIEIYLSSFIYNFFFRLLDTKYMSSLPPFKDKVASTVLPHLLQTLSEPPFALPEIREIF